ncbi:MAG: hypothetical protein JWP97_3741 [Labilithrix sp.]|nr:hypothetical protein [Labilithrix sp.]
MRERLGRLLPLVVAALVIGAVLRLVNPGDIVYLGDEAWTFDHVQEARHGGAWGTLGMPSSRGVQNPAMSVWVFVLLGILGQVETPAGLARMVAVLAVLANVAMLAIPLRAVPEEQRREREAWIWAVVLCATNPILVFVERKIWAQSVLPLLQITIVLAWMKRETRLGAGAWGLVSALVGQIHMAGFFFGPALVVFTWLRSARGRTRWGAWLVGSAMGALPLVPWVLYLARERPHSAPSPWWLRFRLEFYQYFFSDPTGLSSSYMVERDWWRVLPYPVVLGMPTYLVLVAHVALAAASLVIAWRALSFAWRERARWKEVVLGDRTDTGILLAAALVGMGALMTLPSISIHRHYMLALFPLPYVWTARVALREPGGERWLRVLAAGCLVVTVGLLAFVHEHGGADGFGKTWAAQQRDGTSPEAAKDFRP